MGFLLDPKSLTLLPVFRGLSPSDMKELSSLFQIERKQPGEVICAEGTPGDSVFVLLTGEAIVTRKTAQGDAQTLAKLTAPSVVGELALIDGSPRSASVKLTQVSDYAKIDVADFNRLRNAYHPVAFAVLRNLGILLCTRLRETNDKISEFFAEPEKTMSVMQKRQKDLWAQRQSTSNAKGGK